MKLNLLSLGQSAINTGGGLLSTVLANRAARKENQNSREYNLKLAQMQNQWNIEQWQRANDYNSPTAQVKRLKEAGLNPDMLYGGGIQNTATSLPQMTAGAPSSPTSLVGMPMQFDYLDAQLKQAQIDNINANTKKQGAETSILSDDAAFRKALNEGNLRLQNMDIQLKEKQGNLTDQEIKESQKTLQMMDATMQQINTSITEINNRMKNDNERLSLEKAINAVSVKEIVSRTSLNNEQATRLKSELEKVLRAYDDAHSQSESAISLNNSTIDLNAIIGEKNQAETSKINISNGVAEFKANIITARKSDLSLREQSLRAVDDYFKIILQSTN